VSTILALDGAAFGDSFARCPVGVRHHLASHSLLSVEAIAQLAELLPADRVEHNLANLPKVVDPRDVRRSGEPVGDIARGIESNGCWMVLKNIELDPRYRELLDASLDEVAPHVQERDGGMTEREGFIFLSAPGSMTPSHTDPEHNFLLQVRGTKEMSVGSFPDAETEQLALEQALGGGHRNVGWEPQSPVSFDLGPGDGVYVHPHAPHWVQNGDQVSVSLSITFATPASRQRRQVHAANARLRRLGLSPIAPGRRPRVDRLKVVLLRVLGLMKRVSRRRARDEGRAQRA